MQIEFLDFEERALLRASLLRSTMEKTTVSGAVWLDAEKPSINLQKEIKMQIEFLSEDERFTLHWAVQLGIEHTGKCKINNLLTVLNGISEKLSDPYSYDVIIERKSEGK